MTVTQSLRTLTLLAALSAASAISVASGQTAFTVADLRSAIAGARPNSRVTIPAGVYNLGNTGIRIEGKRNVEIIGAGEGKTILRAGPLAQFILELAGSNEGLTVANMTLEAASKLGRNTHALASGYERVNLTGARFHDLDIRNAAVGISVASNATSICDDIWITGNHLDNLQDVVTREGVTSGSGYGIHNDGCTNVRIADNVIRNADRHSIYQASAYQPDRRAASGSVVIEHNLIIDHARTSSLNNEWLVALVVARSSNVLVAHNVIVNPYHDAISIETASTEGRTYSVRNVSLVDNTVLGSGGADVFLSAPGSFTSSGNRFYHSDAGGRPSAPFIRRGGEGVSGKLIGTSSTSVSASERSALDEIRSLISGSAPVRGFAAFGDAIYVYAGSCYYAVDQATRISTRMSCHD